MKAIIISVAVGLLITTAMALLLKIFSANPNSASAPSQDVITDNYNLPYDDHPPGEIVTQSSDDAYENNKPTSPEEKEAAVMDNIKKGKDGLPEIGWMALYQLDYKTGNAPAALTQITTEKRLKIPGFFVPLEINGQWLKSFLLVPDGQSCVHVPPPPPNLQVYVEMSKDISIRELYGPVWVYGSLEIKSMKSRYGAASYHMLADRVELYDEF